MYTIAIKTLMPFNRILRIKMYKNIARSRLFCGIAKRSLSHIFAVALWRVEVFLLSNLKVNSLFCISCSIESRILSQLPH